MVELVTKEDLRLALDNQTLRLMLWLGGFNAALLAAAGVLWRLIG